MGILKVAKTICLLLFLTGSAVAAPAIQGVSGAFNHKATVTISGSGFGTKNTAAPVVWDDASGSNILDKWSGAWPNNNPTYNTIYRSPQRGITLPHNNISKYIAGAHGQNLGADSGYNVIFFKNIPKPVYIFASWYERADDNWVYGGDNNFKTVAYSAGSGPYSTPYWYINISADSANNNCGYVPEYSLAYYLDVFMFPDVNNHSHYWLQAINPMCGKWKKMELEIKVSSGSDGFIRQYETGDWSRFRFRNINYLGSTDTYSGTTRTIGIGGYARMYGQPNNWRYFADAYLDTTLARVALANNVNLNNATVIEMQIPSSWSDGSITVSANLGQFTAGQTAYLFVFDPTGVSNTTGFPITVGGSVLPLLSPPSNLRVQ